MSFLMIFLSEMMRMTRRGTMKAVLVALLLSLDAAVCLAFPQRPQPERLVNDFAGIFTPSQVAALESTLVAFDDSTSNQITVVTVLDLEGDTSASYAYRIGEQWGVGGQAFNNGVVLLIKPRTERSGGEVSIQVGYGLEGAIPDIYCKRIIDNSLLPHFRNGEMYEGTVSACKDLMDLASGEISQPREYGSAEDDVKEILLRLFLFFLVMYILIKITNRRGHGGGGWGGGSGSDFGRHVYIGPINSWDWGTGRGGTGSFGGGGFGGGFGGFGGGHFGGGGASGSW